MNETWRTIKPGSIRSYPVKKWPISFKIVVEEETRVMDLKYVVSKVDEVPSEIMRAMEELKEEYPNASVTLLRNRRGQNGSQSNWEEQAEDVPLGQYQITKRGSSRRLQITIPAKAREVLGLRAMTLMNVYISNGSIVYRKVER